MVRLISPEDGYLFDTHTDIQNTFIEKIHADGTDAALDWLLTVKNDTERTYPRQLTFVWEADGVSPHTLEIAEDADFADPFVTVSVDGTECTVGNFKIGQTYFWRVDGGEVRSFTTKADAPRFIKIDGALNVRDIGGGKLKQGLLYRGSEIERYFNITEAGRRTFTDVLGIRTQLDLRIECQGKLEKSPAGDSVALVQLGYRPYMEVFEDVHKAGIVQIMEFLTHEENYPVYIHCMGGADRTGMIALYLRALAGESDDEIHTDYELTGLSTYAGGQTEGAHGFRNRRAPYYAAFLDALDKYAPGGTLADKVPRFLMECGVTAAQIAKILSIIKA
ncbi:MAG: tyrosine-protein phosphatase [Clostridia bacterium]|nr:tyrosine-protein phosphatase [Clostridia bacterium]